MFDAKYFQISISRLRVSLQAVEQCHGDTMTSLGLASGSGDDGVLPEEVRGVYIVIMTFFLS